MRPIIDSLSTGFFSLVAFCIFVVASPASMAQEIPSSGDGPQLTSPAYVALLFHRLSGTAPNFEAWAVASDEYEAASPFDKMLVRDEKIKKLKDVFGLLAPQEAIVVEKRVKLSQYSRANQGFFIESLTPDLFFAFHFMGENYALVPNAIMDKQWVKVENPEQAKRIEQEAHANDGHVNLVLYLVVTSIDREKPMDIDGENFWLMAADVKQMSLHDRFSQRRLLWASGDTVVNKQIHNELLELKN